jgi:hypothetical protein
MQLTSHQPDRSLSGPTLFVILSTAAILFLLPDIAQGSVLAQGELRVLAVASGINPEVRRTEAAGTENQDAATVSSDYGATNSASYLVSIDRARLESSLSGDNGELPMGSTYYRGAYNGFVDLDLYDDILFTVPAGSYPSGVTATLDLLITGSLSASAGEGQPVNRPRCQGSVYVAFHAQVVDRSYGQLVGGDAPIFVNEPLSLVVDVVPAGANYASETLVTRSLRALVDVAASMNVMSTASGSSQASLNVVFSNPVPSDSRVSWDSSSGAFGTRTEEVPSLVSWAQTLMGALMMMFGYAVLRWRLMPSRQP